MGKEYEGTILVEDFVGAHKMILPEILRVTRPGGSICWQVGYHVNNGTLTPLDYLVHQIIQEEACAVLRNRIIWTYGHGLHCSKRFSGRHETILWYTKGENYTFNLDAVRVPQKYPGKRYHRGPKKGKLSGNPRGKNPGDVWEIPNVKANHVEKTDHPCQFPAALAMQFVHALTNPGQTVLDPFSGSGTTGVAAILNGRRFLGAELNARYWRIAEQRLKRASAGTLTVRPMDRDIYQPDPRTSVAAMPVEFQLVNEQLALPERGTT